MADGYDTTPGTPTKTERTLKHMPTKLINSACTNTENSDVDKSHSKFGKGLQNVQQKPSHKPRPQNVRRVSQNEAPIGAEPIECETGFPTINHMD